ncbi:uncharacterized protein F5Z01DRAFT_672150 [Emericellopsis atlantica]|uniref:Uncharacterized protein n=1 Tax=Emericellopsis atlantica TaxID=2614577 RepID=A0A9P7ZRD5_9HYPO|nr:uncharacterized protein F5Z01DRAFT_672150 [Emericellopsis atlantica]KAG9256924.1 hypothetical protein F5Z01DRAFT_672150 [Emericellopsis atlantica]
MACRTQTLTTKRNASLSNPSSPYSDPAGNMVALFSLISSIALFTFAIRPATAQWYVLGVKDEWETTQPPGGLGYTTHDYSIAVKDVMSIRLNNERPSGG